MAKNGFSMSNRVVPEELSASKQLTAADCGKVFIVESTAADMTLSLPSLASSENGWHITVQTVADPTNTKTVTITSEDASAVFGGVIMAPISGSPATLTDTEYFKGAGATSITMVSGTDGNGQGKGHMGSYMKFTACVMDDFTNVWALEGRIAYSGSVGKVTPFLDA
tara:strand:- start:346 stop:846 length:501 start_codon:yes stop_codon:yes gene_type:complete